MLRVLLATMLVILASCIDMYSPDECPGDKDFKTIKQNFNAYHLFRRHENLYSFISNFDMKKVDIDVMKSSNNGLTWERICKIVSDTSTPLYVLYNSLEDFIETNDGSYWIFLHNIYSYGLYKSTDLGKSWKRQDLKINSESLHFNYDAIHINKNGTIYLYDYWEGIIRSKDNGNTWKYIVSERTGKKFVQFFEDKIFYYQKDLNFMISYDEGDTWIETVGIDTNDMDYFNSKSKNYSMIEGENSTLYFSISLTDSNEYLLFQSTDNGKTWSGIKNSLSKSYMSIQRLIGANKNGDLFAFISENDFGPICYDYEGVFKSTDGGKNWEHILFMPVYLSLMTKDNNILFIEYQNILKMTKEKLF
ncbi:MAG: sialidase family protein [bacterium]